MVRGNTENEIKLRLELQVRLDLIRGEAKNAVRRCMHAIHQNPDQLHARLLLCSTLLKHDPGNNAISNLLPKDLPLEYAHIFAFAQLTGRGKQRQENCARQVAHQYHRQPWNNKLRFYQSFNF